MSEAQARHPREEALGIGARLEPETIRREEVGADRAPLEEIVERDARHPNPDLRVVSLAKAAAFRIEPADEARGAAHVEERAKRRSRRARDPQESLVEAERGSLLRGAGGMRPRRGSSRTMQPRRRAPSIAG